MNGTASAVLPTTIMGAFGFEQFQLQVSCSAEINIANSDIMFVLDVTGSMAECPNGSTSCNGGSNSKIAALRSAVMSFYDTVQGAASPAAQVRYGIVPYSQQVNVGFSIPRDYMASIHSYQSRVARFSPAVLPGGKVGDTIVVSDATEWLPRLTSNLNASGTDPYRFATDSAADVPAGWDTVNFSNIYTSNTINLPVGLNGAMTTVAWGGCIEEAQTVRTDDYDPIPAGADDLNINLVPTSEAQRWKPALPSTVFYRSTTANVDTSASDTRAATNLTCPRAARKLAAITRPDLQTYVNGLTPGGNTYHDMGMLWGARFITPRGIFASENALAPNGDAIARHIVFMTDGVQVNTNTNYSTHGMEFLDRRVTNDGTTAQEESRRAARLQAICRAAQAENITVWVVAFGTTLTQNLIDCASPGRAFQANDSATLTARFQEIAQKIAALRLTS